MKKIRNILKAVAFSGLVLSSATQASIIYDVNRTVGAATVTGTITTDGTIGNIFAANVLDWDLLLDDGSVSSSLTSANSFLYSNNFGGTMHPLIASADTLSFDYGTAFTGVGTVDFWLFYENDFVGFWCLEGPNTGCAGFPSRDAIAINNNGSRVTYQSAVIGGLDDIGATGGTVPAPATLALMGLGLAGLGLRRRMS